MHSNFFTSSQNDDDEDEEDGDDTFDDDEDAPIARRSKEHRESKKGPKSTFSNALLRAGTKSTKDATLDKPIRKMPGLLLEAAGRSLMQKRASASEDGSGDSAKPIGITFGLASSKISFGLYEGHLPIDHASYTKSSGDSESDSERNDPIRASDSIKSTDSATGTISVLGGASTKKVFSNWGGEFFKKNLDYRANTNKILEKMNLNLSVGSNNSGSASAVVAAAATKTSNGDSVVAERFKSSLIGGPKLGLTGSAGLKRPSVDSISSNEASPAKKFFNSYA